MAGTDIFGYNRNPKPQGVFTNSESYLKFGSAGSTGTATADLLGALVQNWNINYTNNITEIFELGSTAIYWVKGRPTGQGEIGRIVGLKSLLLFPASAFDACQGGCTMEIEASPGSCPGKTVTKATLSLAGVLVTTIGFNANVGDTRINESLGFKFATMNVIESTATGAAA